LIAAEIVGWDMSNVGFANTVESLLFAVLPLIYFMIYKYVYYEHREEKEFYRVWKRTVRKKRVC
jgi:hypothetical protein